MSQKKNKGTKGKAFEKAFQNSCKRQGIKCQRLRDNQLSYTSSEKTYKQPYDFETYLYPNLLCLELKATNLSSVTFEREDEENSKMLHQHQIKGLENASQYHGVFAGILIDFLTSGTTYYLPIQEFLKFYNDNDKKSIAEKDIKSLKSIIVDKKLLRTTYEYNINKLFMDITNQ